MKLKSYLTSVIILFVLFISQSIAAPLTKGDPHYTKAGFFDIHVCNWPNRPLFFMLIFSSYDYKNIKSVNIYSPDKTLIREMTLDKYRVVIKKNKPEKHAFINQIDVEKIFHNGWYTAKITMKDGSIHTAKDYVIIDEIPIVSQITPSSEAESIPVPKKLSWEPIEGAALYQVFIRDLWNDGKLIYKSKLLGKPVLEIPDNLIEADGWYSWMVHSRDGYSHVLLGDFNHGSLSAEYKFSTAP